MTDDTEFNTREQIVQTERGFTLEISHKRGTGVRDQDEVTAEWNMEEKPPTKAFNRLVSDVSSAMKALRDANQSEDEQ